MAGGHCTGELGSRMPPGPGCMFSAASGHVCNLCSEARVSSTASLLLGGGALQRCQQGTSDQVQSLCSRGSQPVELVRQKRSQTLPGVTHDKACMLARRLFDLSAESLLAAPTG